MKVIQILPEMSAGGVEGVTLEMAGYLVQEGHEAVVISNGGRMVEALKGVGARHIELPVHRKSVVSFYQVGKLRDVLEKERADILHIRSRVPGWIAYLAWGSMDQETRPRLVSTVHGFYSVSAYSAVMTKGERVIAVSESIRSYVEENYRGVDMGKVRMIHEGIDPDKYRNGYQPSEEWMARWNAEMGFLEGKDLLLLPGRITRLKGHEDFMKLLCSLKSAGRRVHGLIVGNAHAKKQGYLAELQVKVKEMDLAGEVTFLGHRGDLKEIMAVCDVVFGLSQQAEAFGRTVLEALAIGKPVVGYDCGGVGELLGALFPQGRVELGDAEGLLAVTQGVLERGSKPLNMDGRFTLEEMCRKNLLVYKELTEVSGFSDDAGKV